MSLIYSSIVGVPYPLSSTVSVPYLLRVIRIYRVEERQARADAKTVKRARRRIAKRG